MYFWIVVKSEFLVTICRNLVLDSTGVIFCLVSIKCVRYTCVLLFRAPHTKTREFWMIDLLENEVLLFRIPWSGSSVLTGLNTWFNLRLIPIYSYHNWKCNLSIRIPFLYWKIFVILKRNCFRFFNFCCILTKRFQIFIIKIKKNYNETKLSRTNPYQSALFLVIANPDLHTLRINHLLINSVIPEHYNILLFV